MTFQNEAQLASYVVAELSRALPPQWEIARTSDPGVLQWSISPPPAAGGALLTDYLLEVSGDWRLFIFYCGNSDAGPLRLEHFLLQARVISAQALSRYPLAEVFARVRRDCEPNVWGLT